MCLEHCHVVMARSNVFKDEFIIGMKFMSSSLPKSGVLLGIGTDGNVRIAVGHFLSKK